jgi:hypothetical protein
LSSEVPASGSCSGMQGTVGRAVSRLAAPRGELCSASRERPARVEGAWRGGPGAEGQ